MNHKDFDSVAKLLKVIGTPFDESKFIDLTNLEVEQLYRIASKNKIGLLFLESLAKMRPLANLESDYEVLQHKYLQILDTASRIGSILNRIPCAYAIIKTLMPFHAVPNDVDVVILGTDQDFKTAVSKVLENSFILLGEAPLEFCFHDTNGGLHEDPKIKDPFDVDIYKEVGASHVIYMDKKKLTKFVVEREVNCEKIQVLMPPAELAISIFHSIFPERMYTLMLHYQILNHLNDMDNSDFQKFISILSESKISNAILSVLSITETIQEKVFGYCPGKIKELRQSLGTERPLVDVVDLPYVYPLESILKSFWQKKLDLTFTKSLLRQTLNLLNPAMTTHVLTELTKRSHRDTY